MCSKRKGVTVVGGVSEEIHDRLSKPRKDSQPKHQMFKEKHRSGNA